MELGNVIVAKSNKTIYRNKNLKIKVFGEGFSKSHVFNEALNQARVEETGLNIPKIFSVESIDGKLAIISEYIEGKTLQQLMEENPEKTDEYIELMVNLHIDVFSKPCHILNRLNDMLTAKIMESDLDAITRFDLHRKMLEMPNRSKICHGDFTPANIAITDGGEAYIIDWSHTAKGNASADVVRTCLLLQLSGNEKMAEKYLELYIEKSGVDRDYLYKWFPIVSAALSVDVNDEDKQKLLNRIKKSEF